MNFISQMLFQDRFQIISLLAQPLCFSFYRNISVILVVFLVVISGSKKNFSSKSCQFYRRFVVLASCYLLELFHLSDILFLTIRSMPGVVFLFLFTKGHRSRRILRPHISATVIHLSRCFVQVFFNQLVISLFFCF